MKFHDLLASQTYFEISNYVLHENRFEFVKTFLWVLAALPFALVYKMWRTLLKGAGVLTIGLFLTATFGISKGLRELFISRVSSFAANLADWVLLPFALSTCLLRLFLASVIHPSLLT
jgi:hypothetical protein